MFFQSLYDFDHARPLRQLMRKWAELFCELNFDEVARQAYIAHVQHCLRVVPKERLLVMRLEEPLDWEDLCAFLGIPGPEQSIVCRSPEGIDKEVGQSTTNVEDPSTWLALGTVALTVLSGLLFLWMVI